MPPKVKITKEEIINAAIEIIRTDGIAGVNARALGKRLDCSVQPIFRNFLNMDELRRSLYDKIEWIFDESMSLRMGRHRIPFLGMGLAYIEFAKKEGNFFKFLFMSDEFKGKSVLEMIKGEENQQFIHIITGMTGLDFENAEQLFLSIWLITHGIASLMATNDCDLSEEMIIRLLMDSFSGIQYQLRTKGENL